MVTDDTENDTHGPTCMCPWCHSERLTYCLLTKGAADHQDHLIPECPVRPIPPVEPDDPMAQDESYWRGFEDGYAKAVGRKGHVTPPGRDQR